MADDGQWSINVSRKISFISKHWPRRIKQMVKQKGINNACNMYLICSLWSRQSFCSRCFLFTFTSFDRKQRWRKTRIIANLAIYRLIRWRNFKYGDHALTTSRVVKWLEELIYDITLNAARQSSGMWNRAGYALFNYVVDATDIINEKRQNNSHYRDRWLTRSRLRFHFYCLASQ